MNDEINKILEDHIWPPPPTFRPNLSKPTRLLPPLWVNLAIAMGCGLISGSLRAWHLWHTHRNIDWLGDVASNGFIVLFINIIGQMVLRYLSVRQSRDSNVL